MSAQEATITAAIFSGVNFAQPDVTLVLDLDGVIRDVTLSNDVSDESVATGAQAVFEYAHATVRDEDYRLVETLQANLESGVRKQLVFGRNEPGVQHRHITWAAALKVAPLGC